MAESLWEMHRFVKAVGGGPELTGFVVVQNSGDFRLCSKQQVHSTRATQPQNLGRVLVSCDNYESTSKCSEGDNCFKGHVDKLPTDVKLTKADLQTPLILIADRTAKSLYSVVPGEADDTVGLRIACSMRSHPFLKRYATTKSYLCEDHTKRGSCERGGVCPYVHTRVMNEHSVYPPDVRGGDGVLEAISGIDVITDRHKEFVSHLTKYHQIETVSDLTRLSNETFDMVSQQDPNNIDLWQLLKQLRDLSDNLDVVSALKKFHPPPNDVVETLQANSIVDVRSLRMMHFNSLLSLDIPARWMSILQTIRERGTTSSNTDPFKVIDVPDMGEEYQIIIRKLLSLQHNVHPAWRKGTTRQTVTTAITYARDCSCSSASYEQHYLSPVVTPVHRREPPELLLLGGSFSPYPVIAKSPTRDRRDQPTPTSPTWTWCSCKRETVYSVNYELSTPSGSRCSEQNALGVLSSSGLPPSCVREVFVHGFIAEEGNDPNPLFPCGVCENMFRRLSRDVFRTHGGDIILFMFDCQGDNPKRLIRMPFSEISNRESERFRSFVQNEVHNNSAD
eukprot:TRINITY_DN5010_c0_g1_i1.p1 TRINITY_DN5010_c0_g1~~TRINITY_DN5010_c0_g1_i1.p1  ORF type:complete len:562 (+),score=102.13 TRINITY_DN5010_c0_g1_i1:1625-3310(+)